MRNKEEGDDFLPPIEYMGEDLNRLRDILGFLPSLPKSRLHEVSLLFTSSGELVGYRYRPYITPTTLLLMKQFPISLN